MSARPRGGRAGGPSGRRSRRGGPAPPRPARMPRAGALTPIAVGLPGPVGTCAVARSPAAGGRGSSTVLRSAVPWRSRRAVVRSRRGRETPAYCVPEHRRPSAPVRAVRHVCSPHPGGLQEFPPMSFGRSRRPQVRPQAAPRHSHGTHNPVDEICGQFAWPTRPVRPGCAPRAHALGQTQNCVVGVAAGVSRSSRSRSRTTKPPSSTSVPARRPWSIAASRATSTRARERAMTCSPDGRSTSSS